MKNKTLNSAIAFTLVSLALATTAFAATDAATSSPAKSMRAEKAEASVSAKSTKAEQAEAASKAKGDKEIDSRVSDLNALVARIAGIKNVPDAQKATISSTIEGIATAMSNLKQEIDTTSSSTVLKTDLETVTSSYRIYALVMPQVNIILAADKSATVVNMLSVISAKLTSRLNSATSIANQSSLQKTLEDLNAKIISANTLSNDAYQTVIVLAPDQGDKTKMASNTAALKLAKTKIKSAQSSISSARKDVDVLVKAIAKYEKANPTTASSTVPVSNIPAVGTTTASGTPSTN